MPIKKIFVCNYNEYVIYKVVCGIDVYYEAYDGNKFIVTEDTITDIKTELDKIDSNIAMFESAGWR